MRLAGTDLQQFVFLLTNSRFEYSICSRCSSQETLWDVEITIGDNWVFIATFSDAGTLVDFNKVHIEL